MPDGTQDDSDAEMRLLPLLASQNKLICTAANHFHTEDRPLADGLVFSSAYPCNTAQNIPQGADNGKGGAILWQNKRMNS